MLICENIFKRRHFESYSELYLALVIARECYRRGDSLDMTTMSIEKDITPPDMLSYFRYLIHIGAIKIEGFTVEEDLDVPKVYLNTDCLKEMEGCIFREADVNYEWDFDLIYNSCTPYPTEFTKNYEMGNTIMHLVGYYIVSRSIGVLKDKPLKIIISDRQKVASTYLYINLLSCSKSLEWFNDYVQLEINFSEYSVDLDYSIFCNNGIAGGRNKLWSWSEKIGFMEKEGMLEGGMYILWERKGMCEANPIGRIVSATLVRLDGVDKDDIHMTVFPLYKTKEEIVDDYYDIPEDKRMYFSDLLDFKVRSYQKNVSLTSMGIRNYFSVEESMFLDKIDKSGNVTKKITVDGNTDYVEMSQIDAIYWLLCQFEVEFDRFLYKDMYNNGDDLLWDRYGEIN